MNLFASFGLCIALLGCASTKVERSGLPAAEPLCQAGVERLSALVLWGPLWRADQKDVPLREAAAQRGLERFFADSRCFAKVDIRRLASERLMQGPPTAELLALAAAATPAPDKVLVITVRELGPVVQLLASPALVEGGTEVVLEMKAVNVRTGHSVASVRTHWKNGGAFVIKGTGALDVDMSSALQAALLPDAGPR